MGDVVVSQYVYAYHSGKEEHGEFLARPRTWPMSHELEQTVRHLTLTGEWAGPLTRRPDERVPEVHLKPIAAGEVVLNSADSPLKRQLQRTYQDAVAIEMEAAGVAHAAHLNRALPALTVRGISDKADGNKYHSDDKRWQALASRNAAVFAFS